MMWSGFPYPEHPKKELKTMRKRNFIKSFLYYSAIIAIPILTVFLVFLAFVFQGKQREIREDAETAAQAVRDNYSLVLDSAATQYDILARNPRLSISLRGFISHKQIGYLDVILTNTILSNFNSLTNNAPYIASVYYYLDGYDSILTSDTGGTTRLSQFSDLSWKDSYDHSDEDEWLKRREMHQYSYTQPVPVLTYFKKLSMFKGVVMVNIYEEQLKQLINTSSQLDRFFILDKDGNFLLQGGAQTAQLSLEDKDLLVSRLEQSPDDAYRGWVDLSRGKYYVRIIPADCGTYIAACISHSNYYQALYTLLLQFLMVLAAVISTSLWIAYTITKKNFQQIDYFVEVFSDAERGVFNPKKPAFIKDEYDIILNNLVQLFLNQTFLRSQLALKEQEQKLAEMTALQLQINPHFLFNTLQTLDFKAMEYTHKPTAVNQMIEALSDILKYSLQNPHSMVTLKDEIDYLKKYDSIQRYRYEDKYILYYEYEKELESIPIMRLILQPLIENSLYHGIKPLEGSGFIKLRIVRRGGHLIFSVIDSGVGMEKADIQKLYEKIANPGSENIGLTNVNSRLIMRYGECAGLKILSKKGMGTCISFRISIKEIACSVPHKDTKAHQASKSAVIFQDMPNKI